MSDKTDPKDTGLIPTANNSLMTRSSAFVRRGLEDLKSKQVRIVCFPADRSMGKLYLWDKDSTWAEVLYLKKGQCVDARGTITLPAEKQVTLQVSGEPAGDLSPLAALGPEDLQDLSLGSQVDDVGLLNIRGLIGLKRLLLEGTRISDAGLLHLRRLRNLESLSFLGTKVTDAGLFHLRELTELQVLGLFHTQIKGAGLINLSGMKKLNRLFLWGAEINDAGLKNIWKLAALEWLSLQSPQITDTEVDELRRALPKCHIDVERKPKG